MWHGEVWGLAVASMKQTAVLGPKLEVAGVVAIGSANESIRE